METRRITYRLYPTLAQEAKLEEFLELHRELYNATLQERKGAYETAHHSVNYYDQQNQLPGIKAERTDLIPLGAHALQQTLRRVDEAFKHFFRRVRENKQRIAAGRKKKQVGYPRFRSRRTYRSFTYPDPAGWKLLPGRLSVANLGEIKLRGKARTAGRPTTCTVKRVGGKWYASITVECEPQRKSLGSAPVGIDLGLETFAALSNTKDIENPRLLQQSLAKLKAEHAALSRKRQGSRRYEQQRQRVARVHRRVADRRKEFLHQESARLVKQYAAIYIEVMAVARMSRKGGARKRGLNRAIADAGWAAFCRMLEYKCREAGLPYGPVSALSGATQICANCGAAAKKDLSERIHDCEACGFHTRRDHNSALVVLLLGLGTSLSVERKTAARKGKSLRRSAKLHF
jgi:putative transposase